MQRKDANPLVRLLPSLTDVAFLAPLLFLFTRMGGAHGMLGDGDTGWHIRTGEWILANGRVPHTDLFSFTKSGQPWFAWEWLWDVLAAKVHAMAGMAGVILLSIFVISLTYALLYRLARRKCGNVVVAFAITFLAASGSVIHWLARPHLFTLLFVIIFYSILERAKESLDNGSPAGARLLITLPLLTILWTNLHGGFFVGIVLIATYAAGELAGALVAGEGRRIALGRGKPYVLSAAGCLAASFINPYTYHLHEHIVKYLSDPYQFQHIAEFQSVSFHNPVAVWFEVMILLAVPAAFWNLYKRRFAHAFLVAGWVHLALLAGRNIPIFLIVSTPIVAVAVVEVARLLQNALVADWLRRAAGSLENLEAEFGALDRVGRVHLVSAAGLAVVAVLFYAPAPPANFQAEYNPKIYPVGAVHYLVHSGTTGRIFTKDTWGGYLIYRLYPNIRVFVDGRSDFYGDKFGEEYLDVLQVKYDWEKQLRPWNIDTILLPVNAPLAGTLKLSRCWSAVYDDGVAIIFRRTVAGPLGEDKVSAVLNDSGSGRDRKITKSERSDLAITKSTT